jgi:hypothetical protein
MHLTLAPNNITSANQAMFPFQYPFYKLTFTPNFLTSGGRSRLAAAAPVLAFSWTLVLVMSVCEWWYIFFFPGYDPPGL